MKNILAIVQSVAAQTVRSSDSLEDFADAFAGRLRALAIAHDILTHTRWIGIGLSELLVAVLAPHRSPAPTCVARTKFESGCPSAGSSWPEQCASEFLKRMMQKNAHRCRLA